MTLNIGEGYIEPIKFEVGNNTEVVSVGADPVQVNSTDMQLANVVNANQIVAYPLVGRNFTALELIQQGVQALNPLTSPRDRNQWIARRGALQHL